MRRSSVVAGLSLLTLPLMAALCCRPDVPPRPEFDEASLRFTWLQTRTSCFCPEACPTDSLNRHSLLKLLPDHTYQRLKDRQGSIIDGGTWELQGFPRLVLVSTAGLRQEFNITNSAPMQAADSLYLTTHSTTECRNFVFRRLP